MTPRYGRDGDGHEEAAFRRRSPSAGAGLHHRSRRSVRQHRPPGQGRKKGEALSPPTRWSRLRRRIPPRQSNRPIRWSLWRGRIPWTRWRETSSPTTVTTSRVRRPVAAHPHMMPQSLRAPSDGQVRVGCGDTERSVHLLHLWDLIAGLQSRSGWEGAKGGHRRAVRAADRLSPRVCGRPSGMPAARALRRSRGCSISTLACNCHGAFAQLGGTDARWRRPSLAPRGS